MKWAGNNASFVTEKYHTRSHKIREFIENKEEKSFVIELCVTLSPSHACMYYKIYETHIYLVAFLEAIS